MKSTWKVKETNKEIVNEFSNVFGLDDHLSSLLYSKGFLNLTDAFHYLHPKISSLSSPFLMKGMDEAVSRVRQAIENEEKICIFADSDVDGLTSLTILMGLFNNIGIEPYSRFAVDNEEYGLRNELIDEFQQQDIELLITLDCGIRDLDEIRYARKLGIDVIVCDHHEQGKERPDAIVINPKQWDCEYPFKELAGVGVTFKFCHGILMSYLKSFNRFFIIITKDTNGFHVSYTRNGIIEKTSRYSSVVQLKKIANDLNEKDYIIIFDLDDDEEFIRSLFDRKKIFDLNCLIEKLNNKTNVLRRNTNDLCDLFSINKNIFNTKSDILNMVFSEVEYQLSPKMKKFIETTIGLVTLGTIADIMPVIGENRTIIHHGIESLKTTKHPGLSMLLDRMTCKISSKNVAWHISPLLNTPGRFGKADLTARFFLEKDKHELKCILKKIEKLNRERKKLVTELSEKISSEIKERKTKVGGNLCFIQSKSIPDGLSGLLANRIVDITNKPVIVVSILNEEIVKGSGRTKGNFDFFSFVEPLSSLFEKIGGHQKAFGFTAKKENLDTIRKEIESAIGDSYNYDPVSHIDLEIPIENINYDFINSLSIFEPYGYENEESIFLTRKVSIKEFVKFGKTKSHGKFTFVNNKFVEAIGWNKVDFMEKKYEKCMSSGEGKLDIVYQLENNRYNGQISPRMLILDLD